MKVAIITANTDIYKGTKANESGILKKNGCQIITC